MSKHEIDIPELPEGWKPVAFRIGEPNETVIDCGEVLLLDGQTKFPCLIVEKPQPRRIVLEETDEETNEGMQHVFCANSIAIAFSNTKYKWLEVKGTNLPLTNEFHKLSLSADEARSLLDLIIESNPPEIVDKLCNFVEANS